MRCAGHGGDAHEVIFAVLLAAGVAVAVCLVVGAVRTWREQHAGLAYELTPDYFGTALRGVSALAVLGCALVGGAVVTAPRQHPAVTAPASATAADEHRTIASDAKPKAAPSDAGTDTNSGPSTPPSPSPSPSPSSASSAPGGLLTVGHPSGGELREGALPGYPGRLGIWLPGQYSHRSRPLQALAVLADPQEVPDVLAGLVAAVTEGRANPFVVVLLPSGQAIDGDRLRGAVSGQFHVDSSPRSWGVLGIDTGAPGAVAEELDHPDAYAAGVGLSGRYDALVGQVRSLPGVQLLLADAQRDSAGQASAARLRRALTGVPEADVRLSGVVRDFTDQRERVRLVRMAAGYLTERMAAVPHP